MRFKIPALLLLCAALGLMAPGDLDAGEKKKTAETGKSASSEKSQPKKPKSEKKATRREAIQVRYKKLEEQLAESRKEIGKARDSLHMAQKELAAKADAIKALEGKGAKCESALRKANEGVKKTSNELARANGDLKKAEEAQKKTGDELKTARGELAKANEELKKTRDLHKKTSGELAKATEALKNYKDVDFNKLAHALDAERKKTAVLQAQLKETQQKAREEVAKANSLLAAAKRSSQKKPEAKKPEPKKPEPKKPDPKKPEAKKPDPKKPEPKKVTQIQNKPPTVAPIQYELNSAVNYKERDRVLNQLRAALKRSPKAQIQITGYADDTPYEQANKEVGANRAGFLAKYLILKGVPKEKISCRSIGSSRQGKGNGNRKAVIQIRN